MARLPHLLRLLPLCVCLFARFSGDAPAELCDEAGDIDTETGTYAAVLHATRPALRTRPLTCGGFWGTNDCSASDAVSVRRTSSAGDTDPSLLVLFPNNKRGSTASVITTTYE